MQVHNCILVEGHYSYPNGEDLFFPVKPGIADNVEHSVFQLNHYQIKSLQEFEDKIKKGRAGKKIGDKTRIRGNASSLLSKIDLMEELYSDIDDPLLENDVFNRINSLMS